jgi:hypothetical protein
MKAQDRNRRGPRESDGARGGEAGERDERDERDESHTESRGSPCPGEALRPACRADRDANDAFAWAIASRS